MRFHRGESDGFGQRLSYFDIDDQQLWIVLAGIGIRAAQGFCHTDGRLLVASVIDDYLLAFLNILEIFER